MAEDKIMSAREIADAFRSAGFSIQGCSDHEVRELEQRLGHVLPRGYREFLLALGRDQGDFLKGSDLACDKVVCLQAEARSLLSDSGSSFRLVESQVVFVSHQGYQFLFIDGAEGHDPPVWHYLEHDEEPKRVSESFSAWLVATLNEEAESLAKV